MRYVRAMGKTRFVARWVALGALFACNSVTGASDIEFVDGVGGNASSSSNASSSDASTGSVATTDTVGSSTVTGTAASSAVASSGASTSSVASSSSTGSACMYPAGPYGVAQGQVLPPTLKWTGYPAGGMNEGTISTQELFDCDGTKGINAILFDTSQFG
jgi:hypothetical protein